jgi:hypothetical protein
VIDVFYLFALTAGTSQQESFSGKRDARDFFGGDDAIFLAQIPFSHANLLLGKTSDERQKNNPNFRAQHFSSDP